MTARGATEAASSLEFNNDRVRRGCVDIDLYHAGGIRSSMYGGPLAGRRGRLDREAEAELSLPAASAETLPGSASSKASHQPKPPAKRTYPRGFRRRPSGP